MYWCVYTYAGPHGRPALLTGYLPVLNQILSIYLSIIKGPHNVSNYIVHFQKPLVIIILLILC